MGSPWMPLYWGDYYRKTLHFTTFQHGCYLLLIGAYWSNGGPISADPKYLAQVCRTSCDKLARWGNPVIAMFTCKDGLLYHKRIDFELLRSSNRQAAAIANGIAGGLAKSKLPTPIPITIEERKKEGKIFVLPSGFGKTGGDATTIKDPAMRIARFQQKLASALGPSGWMIIDAAMKPEHPEHEKCLNLCKGAAEALGKGWPRNWPIISHDRIVEGKA